MKIPFGRVLVAVDFSEEAETAARWTARHLAPSAEIVLLNVVHVPTPPAFLADLAPEAGEVGASARRGAEQRLRELAAGVPADRIWTEVREGRPADAITAAVDELGVDLVVMGRRGAGAVGRAVLGSVASSLARDAACPLLLVTAKSDE